MDCLLDNHVVYILSAECDICSQAGAEVLTDKVPSCVQLIPNGSRKKCKDKARETDRQVINRQVGR